MLVCYILSKGKKELTLHVDLKQARGNFQVQKVCKVLYMIEVPWQSLHRDPCFCFFGW